MTDPSVFAVLALAASALLPARPAAVTSADVDADGTPELVLLLVWDDWGTMHRDVAAEPGVSEIDVVPAIRERRELRVLELDASLTPAAEPLPVGPEVFALDGDAATGDAYLLTADGPARVVVRRAGDGPPGIVIEPVARVLSALRGAERVYSGLRFVHGKGMSGAEELFVPVDDGLAVVDREGGTARLPSPLRETSSGALGTVRYTIPELIELGDGARGLLDVTRRWSGWREPRAAWRPVDPAGRPGPATVWRLGDIVRATPAEKSERRIRELADVGDLDRDGTLEAAVAVIGSGEADSLGSALDAIRGQAGRIDFHSLTRGGAVAAIPESSIPIEGHLFPLPRPNGVRSPFRDLDGDGQPELVTFTVSIGLFGAGRAVLTGKAKATLHPVIVRRVDDERWGVVPGAVPSLVFRQNLRRMDLSRFFDWSGDLDGDGLVDLVEVDGREIRLRYAVEGPRYSDDPDTTIRLADSITGWGGVRFRDLDGDDDLDLIAFTPTESRSGEKSDDALARKTRLEIRMLGGAR